MLDESRRPPSWSRIHATAKQTTTYSRLFRADPGTHFPIEPSLCMLQEHLPWHRPHGAAHRTHAPFHEPRPESWQPGHGAVALGNQPPHFDSWSMQILELGVSRP
jgi:hypothetical protein